MPALIFDFDGVVVDSEAHWPDLWKRLLPRFTSTIPSDDYHHRFVGLGTHGTHEILTRELGMTLAIPEYEAIVLAEAVSIYQHSVQPLPGAIDCLDRLKTHNVPMAIGSSNVRRIVEASLAQHALENYFRAICTGDDVPGRSKPHPDVFLLAANQLGAAPSSCMVIEDSTAGVMAAKAAGMHCIALHTDHNAHADLSGADTHITHFDELTDERLALLLG